MKILVSCDDGNQLDLKLAELLKKYDIAGLFFIPNISDHRDLSSIDIQELSKDFDIGGHTTTHPSDMKLLSYEEQLKEIVCNKGWLEGIIGKNIEWFCYPRGRYNEDTLKAVEMAGFKKARTTLIGHYNYENSLRIHPSIHIYQREEYGGDSWLDYAKKLFLVAREENADYFHIWCHSHEIEKFGLWKETEELFKYIS